jgi:uncharacterized protein (TIGR00369 family)
VGATGGDEAGGEAPGGPREIVGVSAAQADLGYRLAVEGPGAGRAWLRPGPRHGNRAGVLHGGLVSTLLDAAMGTAAATRVSEDGAAPMATVSMTVQFLAPVPLEAEILARARITGGGRRLIFCEATLTLPDGAAAATATGVFRAIRPPGG